MRIFGLFLLCASTPLLATEECPDANTTNQIGVCLSEQLELQEVGLQHYLAEARARYAEDELIVESIDKAQQSWLTYRKDHCSTTYNIWRDGTIRSIEGLNCSIRMTRLRTHLIWQSYLTYRDGTPPLLPEPQLTE